MLGRQDSHGDFMPLIDDAVGNQLSRAGVSGVTSRQVKKPTFEADDYSEGFQILEYENGAPKEADKVILKGPFMPHVPFTFGGSQRLVKEYYPGSSEPTVQVLGPQENELTITGRIYLKKFKKKNTVKVDNNGVSEEKEINLRAAAIELQELIDAMRIRGNLVYITLGHSWKRWGFIESCNFELKTATDIKYEIKFFIAGFNQPKNCKIIKAPDPIVIKPNKELTDALLAATNNLKAFPDTMPRTLAEYMNDQINTVASAIKIVTGFVDDALKTAEQINASANRAIGLIRNARATISQAKRRIGTIAHDVSTLGSSVSSAWNRQSATVNNSIHIHKARAEFANLSVLLAALQARFEGLRTTVPMVRHLVKSGDTLQKLALKYYNNSDNWDLIYKHNKLSTTELVVGTVLEIPKI